MPLPPSPYAFPDARSAPGDGPAAMGADFEPSTLVAAYRAGYFPWPQPEAEYLWYSPDPRAILPVGGLHVSRRLARTIRSGRFPVTVDAAFERVILACADRPEGTWITENIVDGYLRLHELGWAHSFETWTEDGRLAGGLYGLRVGGLFGAESMFHHVTDASKVAMAAMMQWAESTSISLIDVQVLTPHTARMGAVEIPREDYRSMLDGATR
ncbi:leucyl/phenylalanyl-tRNA--protein transferase [bacterium]|nr:leucyl/phenylalanyl-tRNA--protein transferase [bacterium]